MGNQNKKPALAEILQKKLRNTESAREAMVLTAILGEPVSRKRRRERAQRIKG